MTSFVAHELIQSETLHSMLPDTTFELVRVIMKNPADGSNDSSREYLPGSALLNLDTDGSDTKSGLPHTLPSQQAQSTVFGQLGISIQSPVVIYDNRGMFCAARVFWMFKALGHKHVSLLDGGLPAWKQSGYLTNSEPTLTHARLFEPEPVDGWFVDNNAVQTAISTSTQIVDARSSARFTGEEPDPRSGVRAGHIPGSINLHYQDVLDERGRFKPKSELIALLNSKNIDIHEPVICTCGSGITACIIAFAIRYCGASQVSVYDGSWAEWGADNNLPAQVSA